MKAQAEALEHQASAAYARNSAYVQQLEEENCSLKERVAYLESLLKEHLK